MSKKIKDSFEKIKVNDEDKEQMLEQIWSHRKNDKIIKLSKMRKCVNIAAIFAICLILGSATVYAVGRVISGEQLFKVFYQDDSANIKGVNDIATKFNKNKSDVKVVKCNEYIITYLGFVTSKDILDKDLNKNIEEGVTYLAVAIEKTNGFSEKYENMNEQFVISPFIQGYEPRKVNAFSLGASSKSEIIDNVYYIIMKYDTNLEAFADRNIYIGVFDYSTGKDGFGYKMDSEGNIIRDEKCNNLNALFSIKLDKSKADNTKANEIIRKIIEKQDSNEENEERMVSATQDELRKLCDDSTVVEKDTVMEKDSDGAIRYGYKGRKHNAYKEWLEEGNIDYQWDYREEDNTMYIYKMYFKNSQYYQTIYKYNGDPAQFEWIKEWIKRSNR